MAIAFKVKKLVTVPLLKTPDNGTPIYVRITSEIFDAKDTEGRTPRAEGTQKKQPPKLAHVVNLETGEVQQIIIGTVLGSELNDQYPDNGYVGKSFEIKKLKPAGGKSYAMYQIAEIEVDEGVETASEALAEVAKAKEKK
jgi:hypothetical protein